jgi:hypothetical protein
MADYRIPLKYRRMENLHIVFWLLKDIGWCLIWKPLGLLMIFPTLIIAVMIAYRTRDMMSELCHNLAIAFWITANSYWMISEFFKFDEKIAVAHITFKQMALVPFLIGLFCLLYYYWVWQPQHPNEEGTM